MVPYLLDYYPTPMVILTQGQVWDGVFPKKLTPNVARIVIGFLLPGNGTGVFRNSAQGRNTENENFLGKCPLSIAARALNRKL